MNETIQRLTASIFLLVGLAALFATEGYLGLTSLTATLALATGALTVREWLTEPLAARYGS